MVQLTDGLEHHEMPLHTFVLFVAQMENGIVSIFDMLKIERIEMLQVLEKTG